MRQNIDELGRRFFLAAGLTVLGGKAFAQSDATRPRPASGSQHLSIMGLAFSPAGDRLAVLLAHEEERWSVAEIWRLDGDTPSIVARLQADGASQGRVLEAPCYSADGALLAAVAMPYAFGHGGTVELFDAARGAWTGRLGGFGPGADGMRSGATDLAFAGQRLLAVGYNDGSAAVWDAVDRRLLRMLVVPGAGSRSGVLRTIVAGSPDGRVAVVSGGANGPTGAVFDAASGTMLGTMDATGSFRGALAFSGNGRLLAGYRASIPPSDFDEVVLWTMPEGDERVMPSASDPGSNMPGTHRWVLPEYRRIRSDRRGILRVVFTPDGQLAMGHRETGMVRMTDIHSGSSTQVFDTGNALLRLAISTEGILATASSASSAGGWCLYDLPSGRELLRVVYGYTILPRPPGGRPRAGGGRRWGPVLLFGNGDFWAEGDLETALVHDLGGDQIPVTPEYRARRLRKRSLEEVRHSR